jgi:hypothetical protein
MPQIKRDPESQNLLYKISIFIIKRTKSAALLHFPKRLTITVKSDKQRWWKS